MDIAELTPILERLEFALAHLHAQNEGGHHHGVRDAIHTLGPLGMHLHEKAGTPPPPAVTAAATSAAQHAPPQSPRPSNAVQVPPPPPGPLAPAAPPAAN